jgi:uncharacterized protein (TIGR03086 family)
VELAKQPGLLDRTLQIRFGEESGYGLILNMLVKSVVHGWDLAKATGQDATLLPEAADALYLAFADRVEAMRQSGSVGPVVDVPDGASTGDKVIAMFDRQP